MINICLALSCLFLLNGCDSIKSSLGLDHYQADEFEVPDNKPLVIPDDLTLKEPVSHKNIKDVSKKDQNALKNKPLSNKSSPKDIILR